MKIKTFPNVDLNQKMLVHLKGFIYFHIKKRNITLKYLRDSIDLTNRKTKLNFYFFNLAECSVINKLFYMLISWKVARPYCLHEEELFGLGVLYKFLRLFLIHCQRFFAENMFAMIQHQHADIKMSSVHSSNINNV